MKTKQEGILINLGYVVGRLCIGKKMSYIVPSG